jgi:predicted nucleotidyltransferase
MIAEIYKQNSIVAKHPVMRGIFKTILLMHDLPLVILYGSYAKGTATKESDIDVYIDTTDSSVKNLLEQKHSRISVKTGAFDTRDLLIREIMKEHIIIRGVEVYFDKMGFFAETA